MSHEQFLLWLAGAVDTHEDLTPELWAKIREKLAVQVGSIVKRQMLEDQLNQEMENAKAKMRNFPPGPAYAGLIPPQPAYAPSWFMNQGAVKIK